MCRNGEEEELNSKEIMDFTYIHDFLLSIVPGLTPEILNRHYKLFFDETNNTKKFHLKDNNRLNVPAGVRFVLGGIVCDNDLSQEELNGALALQKNTNELKFDQIYGHANWCDFAPVLKSRRLTKFLNLLDEKRVLIHFSSVNLFYFALVDIIDSLKFDLTYVHGLKSVLYQVAQQNPDSFVNLFRDYTYPDVKDIDGFLNDLETIINSTTISDAIGKQVLLYTIKENKSRKELMFIQEETQNIYIKDFLPFYQEPMYKFANSDIVLDNEVDMKAGLNDWPVEVNGKKVNYSFVDSKDVPWIQMSDVAASLVARYLYFVDADDYKDKINQFTEQQLNNFKHLNRILAASERENKLFWHFTDDIRVVGRFSNCVNNYQ